MISRTIFTSFVLAGAMIGTAHAQTDYSSIVSAENLASTGDLRTATGITDIFGTTLHGKLDGGEIVTILGGPSFADFYAPIDFSSGVASNTASDLDAQDDDTDFRWDGTETAMADDDTLYIWDYNEDTGSTVVSVDTAGNMTEEVNSEDFPGISSLAWIDSTTLAYTRDDAFGGNQSYGTIDLSSGTVTEKATMSGIPESIVYDGTDAYILTQNSDVIRVENITGTPTETDVTPTGWSGADINNFYLGPDGEFVATDLGNTQLRIWDGANETTVSFADIETEAGITSGIVNPVNDGGIFIDPVDATTTEIYIANWQSGEDDLSSAILKVEFERTTPTSVNNWSVYK